MLIESIHAEAENRSPINVNSRVSAQYRLSTHIKTSAFARYSPRHLLHLRSSSRGLIWSRSRLEIKITFSEHKSVEIHPIDGRSHSAWRSPQRKGGKSGSERRRDSFCGWQMGAPSSQGNFKDETLNANGTGNSRSIVSEINLGQFLFFF